MVRLSPEVLARYPRFSLYNSPYVAHDEGCAIDLYPERGVNGARDETGDARTDGRATAAPSPVAGEVVETRTVTAPPKPYAVEHDHLIVVDTGDHFARILHVDPSVVPGDEVAVGEPLGELVRSGFFAPWVANHIHLGFRTRDANPLRASGSLPIGLPVEIDPVSWDGTGTVVETGETWVVLDSPSHPAPGERFAGIEGGDGVVLDGGLPHYEGGGALRTADVRPADAETAVSLLGRTVGVARGRTVVWDDVTVRANGVPLTGVSLFVSREQFGAKLVRPGHEFSVGERVAVTVD